MIPERPFPHLVFLCRGLTQYFSWPGTAMDCLTNISFNWVIKLVAFIYWVIILQSIVFFPKCNILYFSLTYITVAALITNCNAHSGETHPLGIGKKASGPFDSTVQYKLVQCSSVQFGAVQCSTVISDAVQCSSLQRVVVQFSAVQKIEWSRVEYME